MLQAIDSWLSQLQWNNYQLQPASEDASFRRYFRLTRGDQSYIVMDTSQELESLPKFVEVTQRLRQANVHAPKIIAQELALGYLILEDFGSTHYLDLLNTQSYIQLYTKAIEEIVTMQQADPTGLPLYDKAFLRFEMELMQTWYLEKLLDVKLTEDEKKIIDTALENIADTVLLQPQSLFVHRDYHSRNLMLTPKNNLGVIDYQDAMNGALTYDLVSLLKDCYIEFDKESINTLALHFRDLKKFDVDDKTFLQWFDFMGMQRHIKVLGIFSRLSLRDGKDGYLKDIPLTRKYLLETAELYPQTMALAQLLTRITA